jgi:Hypervirulence associated proteins TUDOR domain
METRPGARCVRVGLTRSMAQELSRGDRVEWNFRGARVVGTVRRKLTSRTVVSGRVVAASKEDPRYLVRSEKTGKETTRKAQALRRLP